MEASRDGQNGHGQLMKVAVALKHGFGYGDGSRALAWESDGKAIFEDFNRRGDPESPAQLAHKWASATTSGKDLFREVQEEFERNQKPGGGTPPRQKEAKEEKKKRIVRGLVPATEVGPLPPTVWLWEDFLPLACLGLVDGWPGGGKSTALGGIMAAVTRPGDWIGPTGSLPGAKKEEAGHGIWITAEETAERIKARLEACGADLEKVSIVRHITEAHEGGRETRRTFSLPEDLELLRGWLAQYKPLLVVLDNMSALFSPEYDSTKSQKSRSILNELLSLAEEHGTTILLVRHQTKGSASKDFGTNGPAWLAGEGSIAFAGAARLVLRVGYMAEDLELPNKWERRRVLHVAKMNEGREDMGTPFRIQNIELPDGASVRIPKWEPAQLMDDSEVSSSGRSKPGPKAEKLPAAKEAIEGLFRARGGKIGHSELEELKHQLEQNEGFSSATLRRATEELRKSHFIKKDGKAWVYTPPLVTSEAELRALASDLSPTTSQGKGSGT
jgi:KaiC/GvpD/RAD55 family RecA-like ATPase